MATIAPSAASTNASKDWFADIFPAPSAQRSLLPPISRPHTGATVAISVSSPLGLAPACDTSQATPANVRFSEVKTKRDASEVGSASVAGAWKPGPDILDTVIETQKWATLRQLMEARPCGPKAKVVCVGAAAQFPRAARDEVVYKLITNHVAVIADVTNPAPLTQTHLVRVSRAHTSYVDQALREVARRLLGRRVNCPEALLLDSLQEERVDALDSLQAAAWHGTFTYLNDRIHSTREDCPRRKPDLSETAAEAMKAVLEEVCHGNSCSGGMLPGSIFVDRPSAAKKSATCVLL